MSQQGQEEEAKEEEKEWYEKSTEYSSEQESSEEDEWESEEEEEEKDDFLDLKMSSKHLRTYRSYFVFKPNQNNNKRNRTSVADEKTIEAVDQNLIMDLTRIVSQFSMEIWRVQIFDRYIEEVVKTECFFSSKELSEFYRAQQRREQINSFIPHLCWLRGKMSSSEYATTIQESLFPLFQYLDSYSIDTTQDGILGKLFKNNIFTITTYRLKDSVQDDETLEHIASLFRALKIYKRLVSPHPGLIKFWLPAITISMVQYSDNTVREAYNKRQKQQAD